MIKASARAGSRLKPLLDCVKRLDLAASVCFRPFAH